eukprot:CAMPEP_0201565458 /NCGR_PEP_ID=MMETSP0190_2-20130828/4573_1 /ASSEMBLY_ACC=CAM_ASM_000263 /TAXON_ID=37353 /ORGANISM="Rosalina sp." /LENGTH=101 /DNA_ID=CAMNT_0047982969 /DNA_START=24 /DNA_END=326 /DNA_ORIENTATION=-
MQNSPKSIFEETSSAQNSNDSYEVIEGNADDSITTIEQITAGNTNDPITVTPQTSTDGTPTIIESKPIEQSKLNQITTELYEDGKTIQDKQPSNPILLWHW